MRRCGVLPKQVGKLQVGSESLLDRSKSIKSHLMALFPRGSASVEGVDDYHACYGGTAALFTCTNWVESSAWDGRWAVAVATDVSAAPSQFPCMSGVAAVAMLGGADADAWGSNWHVARSCKHGLLSFCRGGVASLKVVVGSVFAIQPP